MRDGERCSGTLELEEECMCGHSDAGGDGQQHKAVGTDFASPRAALAGPQLWPGLPARLLSLCCSSRARRSPVEGRQGATLGRGEKGVGGEQRKKQHP